MDHTLQDGQRTLMGQWLKDIFAAFHAVRDRPEVNRERLAVAGLSTGATLAALVAALDERFRALIVAGVFTTNHHIRTRFRIPPGCDCGAQKYLFESLEPCDLAALTAPRWQQLQLGRQDSAFCPDADPALLKLEWMTGILPGEEFEMARQEAERAYRTVNASPQIRFHFHGGAHAMDTAAALEWLENGTRELGNQ